MPGHIDTDKVEILEMALERLPADRPDRALVLATLCSELTIGSPLERRRALAEEALAIAERPATMRSSSGSSTTCSPARGATPARASLARTADALVAGRASRRPGAAVLGGRWRGDAAALAGDVDEMDRCLESWRRAGRAISTNPLQLDAQPRCVARPLIAGDTDQAEQLANEALQIGTDGGEPDATNFYRRAAPVWSNLSTRDSRRPHPLRGADGRGHA